MLFFIACNRRIRRPEDDDDRPRHASRSLTSQIRDMAKSCSSGRQRNGEEREWTAQVEPGVFITFVSSSDGGNHLKRIRFREEMFDQGHAQRWWAENFERVAELYNVRRFSRRELCNSKRMKLPEEREVSVSAGNGGDQDGEWVEEDQPGVFVTVCSLPSGVRELRRVRFSRYIFSETLAQQWWEQNRVRIHQQYL